MKRLLKKFGFYESLDMELQMSPEHAYRCLQGLVIVQPYTIYDLLSFPSNSIDYQWTYREVSGSNKLRVLVNIFPKHYIYFFMQHFSMVFGSAFLTLVFSVLVFFKGEYGVAFGSIIFCLFVLFIYRMTILRRMQWRVWDVRLAIEKELRRAEKQLMDTDNQ